MSDEKIVHLTAASEKAKDSAIEVMAGMLEKTLAEVRAGHVRGLTIAIISEAGGEDFRHSGSKADRTLTIGLLNRIAYRIHSFD